MTGDFAPYLTRGEVVRWSGRPKQGFALRTIDGLLIPFSIAWCAFAIFWEYNAASGGVFFMLWGAMFVCAGLYLVFGRFFVDAFLRSRVSYALTDRRALILGGLNGNKLTEVDLLNASEIRYAPNSGSSGTISFGPDLGPFRNGGIWHSTSQGSPQFFQTDNALAAYRHIQSIKAARS